MSFNPDNIVPPGAKIKVIGIGGGGGNAVNTMIRSSIDGVDFVGVNTDIQSLSCSLAPKKIQVGKELTKGLGAGADPDIGRDAVLEDRNEIQEALIGADMVFVTAGMGGGTGTGGASIIAQIARELGALTVGVVTKPFDFEGRRRKRYADMGIAKLRESVDTLITIPNQRLLQIATPDLSMVDAFKLADDVLVNAVKGISDIINIPGTINVDFADVKTVMSGMGLALMGIGRKTGENRARAAAEQAISSPLLEDVDIEGATGILINITAGSHITLMEVNEACTVVQEAAHEDANIIFGAVIDEAYGDDIQVTVIATGFPSEFEETVSNEKSGSSNYYKDPAVIISGAKSAGKMGSFVTSHKKEAEEQKPGASAFSGSAKMPEPIHTEEDFKETAPEEPNDDEENASPTISPVQEASDLAKWTMGDIETNANAEQHEPELNLQNVDQNAQTDDQIEVNSEEQDITPKPMEPLFDPPQPSPNMFDKKIDEALELADKLQNQSQENSEEDNLDIPAFLRNKNDDLSLD